MRSRMSRSYIEGLRGSSQLNLEQLDDGNLQENTSHSSLRKESVPPNKISTLSLPPIKYAGSTPANPAHSTLSLNECNQSEILVEKGTDAHEMSCYCKKESVTQELPFKSGAHRLTVQPVGDYCLRMSNISSVHDRPAILECNDSRVSDALGYLRMYQSNNRIQFNTLQFDDRADLQVKSSFERSLFDAS